MSNQISASLLKVIEVGNQLGEGVQWHGESQSLWWTDIENSCLFNYSLLSKQLVKHAMPERVGCFSFIENDNRLIIAFASGFAFFNMETNELNWLAQPELRVEGNRFNDGRSDRQGRFFAGTMVEKQMTKGQHGNLYCLDANLNCTTKLTNIQISNGLCWSPDGKVMYHADSPSRKIYKYSYGESDGGIDDKTLFAQTPEGIFPDGSCVDKQGFLWSAQWGGGRVVRYDLNGDINFTLTLPVSQPSCVCFAGENLDLLVVTTAKQGLPVGQLKSEPFSGHLFIYQLAGASGLMENNFKLSI